MHWESFEILFSQGACRGFERITIYGIPMDERNAPAEEGPHRQGVGRRTRMFL